MRNWLHKKIAPLLLSLVFSVFSFGIFASVASANITTDLNRDLRLDPALYIPNRVTEIPPEISSNDRIQILNAIETNQTVVQKLNGPAPSVQSESQALDVAQVAYQTVLDKAKLDAQTSLGFVDPLTDAQFNSFLSTHPAVQATLQPAIDTRDAAHTSLLSAALALGDALVVARNLQEDAIKLIKINGGITNLSNLTILGTTVGGAAASAGITAQGVADTGNQPDPQAFPPSQTPPQAAPSQWLNADNGSIPLVVPCIDPHNGSIFPTINLMSCLADYVFFPVYEVSSFALKGSGLIFDTMLSLSIDNKDNMVVPDFINSSWTIVRDFSNMIFIFILLYTGIMTMFGAADWRKVILQVVVIALLINFSLFFTKVIIDAGNVFAVGIKNAIGGPSISISAGLVAGFQPQKFLTYAGAAANAGDAIIVFVVATVVSGFAAYVIFKAALLFLGRLIGFWFLMIASPFAFISTTLPKGNKFQSWLESLLGLSFAAPVFLFFIYLILLVIQSGGGILSKFPSTGIGWFEKLLGPTIVAILIVVALKKSLEFTESMAGSFGKMGAQMMSAAMTTVSVGARVGVATVSGGASLAMSGAQMAAKGFGGKIDATTGKRVGGFGGFASEGGKWDQMGAGMNKFKESKWGGRATNVAGGAGKFLKESSFDIRNVGGDNSILGHVAGGLLKQGVGALGIGKGVGAGGVAASQAKQDKINQEGALKAAQGAEMTTSEKVVLLQAQADKQRAERKLNAAKLAHEKSRTGALVKLAEGAMKSIQEVAKKATEKTASAQKSYDVSRNSGKIDPALLSALADAQKEEAKVISEQLSADATLTKARADDEVSDEATVFKAAVTELATATTRVAEETTKVNEENDHRRYEIAEKIEKKWLGGAKNIETANKIRDRIKPDASKKDLEKYLKELMGGGTTPKAEPSGEDKH